MNTSGWMLDTTIREAVSEAPPCADQHKSYNNFNGLVGGGEIPPR